MPTASRSPDGAREASAVPGQRPLLSLPSLPAAPIECSEFCFLMSPKSGQCPPSLHCPACQSSPDQTDTSPHMAQMSARGAANLQGILRDFYARQEQLERRLGAAVSEQLEQQYTRLLLVLQAAPRPKPHLCSAPSNHSERGKSRWREKHAPSAQWGPADDERISLPSTLPSRMNTQGSACGMVASKPIGREEDHLKLLASPPAQAQVPRAPPLSNLTQLPEAAPMSPRLAAAAVHGSQKRISASTQDSFKEVELDYHRTPTVADTYIGPLGVRPQNELPMERANSLGTTLDTSGRHSFKRTTGEEAMKGSGTDLKVSATLNEFNALRTHRKSTLNELAEERASMRAGVSMERNRATARPGAIPSIRKGKNIRGSSQEGTWMQRLIFNPVFDTTCALVIVMNGILIGYTVQWLTENDKETVVLISMGHICSAFFFVELCLRIWVFGVNEYLMGQERTWNWFDFALVGFSIIDVAITSILGSSGAGSVGSTLKIVKMLRIVRIFRVFRFFKELSLLALMIMDSLRSLVWAMLMLTIIIYVFAICFTQNATDHLNSLPSDTGQWTSKDKQVRNQFGSLPLTIYFLVQSMLGGISWGLVCDTLIHMDALSTILFFFYISFTVLAVLNIITGVFVDNAVETAKTEREFLIQKEMELREKLTVEMHALFMEMDEDKSGSVNFEELSLFFEDERVQGYFQALGLEGSDTERLFRLLDTTGSGEVDIDEFLEGCIRLKGEARSIDVHSVMFECRKIMTRLDDLEHMFSDEAGHDNVPSNGNGAKGA